MKTISLRIPDKLLEDIDNLVKEGRYANRTEALREAARNLLNTHNGFLPGTPKQISKEEIWEEFKKTLE
jgi:Arc/MetJ-type ribon-helix-helix transcriptional regulator